MIRVNKEYKITNNVDLTVWDKLWKNRSIRKKLRHVNDVYDSDTLFAKRKLAEFIYTIAIVNSYITEWEMSDLNNLAKEIRDNRKFNRDFVIPANASKGWLAWNIEETLELNRIKIDDKVFVTIQELVYNKNYDIIDDSSISKEFNFHTIGVTALRCEKYVLFVIYDENIDHIENIEGFIMCKI